MKYITGGLTVLFLILVVIFSIQNLGSVEVTFLTWTTRVSKIILILGTYFIGMLSGWGLVELVKKMVS